MGETVAASEKSKRVCNASVLRWKYKNGEEKKNNKRHAAVTGAISGEKKIVGIRVKLLM